VSAKTTNTVQDLSKLNATKDAARQCLLAADKYLKELQFDLAKQQLEKAKELDPSNAYIFAFQDRITHFEATKKKEAAKQASASPATPSQRTIPKPPTETPKPPASPPTPPPKVQQEQPAMSKAPADAIDVAAYAQMEEARLAEDRRRQESARVLAEFRQKEAADRPMAEMLKKREFEAMTAAEDQRRREMETRLEAERHRQRELEYRLAGEEERRRQDDNRMLEERRRLELEARARSEEQRRRELEARVAEEERKRKDLEYRIASEERRQRETEALAAEEQRRRELEIRAAAEDQKRRELEARIAAEEQRRKEMEARMAAEEQRFREEMARREEERRRKELEARAAAEEQLRKDLEIRVAEEEKKRKELEKRAATEEIRRKDVEAKIQQEEGRRRQFEDLAASEERLRRELEEKMREEMRRRQEEVHLVEEMRRKEADLRVAEEQRKLEDMRRQVEELTRALEQEKSARQEISRLNLQSPAKQLRGALEEAWLNGAPDDNAAQELHQRAVSMSIPPDIEQSLIREVKLDMYSKAVKEVVAKKKLLRSSSSTLEWLRKVYQVSVAEYLENESKFLLDLVADQYKGTLLLVSKSIGTKEDITPRQKSITPENALEKIEKVNPNIILCDADFPGGLSGIRFLHVLRANSKFNYIPFVLIGEAAEVAQLKSSELRPNEGVVKQPIEYDELTNLMNEKLLWFREYISSLK
jgi:hypothetical protein